MVVSVTSIGNTGGALGAVGIRQMTVVKFSTYASQLTIEAYGIRN